MPHTLITEYDKQLDAPVHVIINKVNGKNFSSGEKEYLCCICGEKFISKSALVISRGHRTKGYGLRYYCVKCADITGTWKNTPSKGKT